MNNIKIQVNGEELEFPESTTINNVLDKLNINRAMFVVEKNCEVIPKDKLNLLLKDQDNLEILVFCSGG